MALPDWVSITSTVGGVLLAVGGLFKVRSESRKLQTDEKAAILTAGAGVMAASSTSYVKLLERVDVLEAWQRTTQRAMRRHMVWDNEVVPIVRAAGIEIPPPPPLFDDDEDPPQPGRKAG